VLAIAAGTFVVCAITLRLPLAYIQRTSVVKALRFS